MKNTLFNRTLSLNRKQIIMRKPSITALATLGAIAIISTAFYKIFNYLKD